MILTIAFSRLFLGMHWLTDVISSVLLATAILHICKAFFPQRSDNYHQPENEYAWLIGIFLIPYIATNVLSYHQVLSQTTLQQRIIHTTTQQWWQHTNINLPSIRRNRLDHPVDVRISLPKNKGMLMQFHRINVKAAGTVKNIKKRPLKSYKTIA